MFKQRQKTLWSFLGLVLLALSSSLLFATPTITNTASVSYIGSDALPHVLNSNTVSAGVLPAPTPSHINFLRYSPPTGSQASLSDGAQCFSGGVFNPITSLQNVNGSPISLAGPLPLNSSTVYRAGEPIFLDVSDLNRNHDPLVREYIEVTIASNQGDSETLKLLETGINTGHFVGGINSRRIPPALSQNNCILEFSVDTKLTVNYADDDYNTDTAIANILIDPYGVLFNSQTGTPINGITISIVDALTGLPATVFDDDGITPYPHTIITGSTFTVGSQSYTMPAGGYRFPLMPPGQYKFIFSTIPNDYSGLSKLPLSQLLTVTAPSGSHYTLIPGYKGDPFYVIDGPPIKIDIPIDPFLSALYLEKKANKTEASLGDFIRYEISLQNKGTGSSGNIELKDFLPLGIRYKKDSLILDGVKQIDPVISSDGREMTIAINSIPSFQSKILSYVTEVSSLAPEGVATNKAIVPKTIGAPSNEASVDVLITNPFLNNVNTLIGTVYEVESCEKNETTRKGVANIKVLLEDGTYATTDAEGRYHFEKIIPGTHVVQINENSLPKGSEILLCNNHSRKSSNGISQFVDASGGSLWRNDFFITKSNVSATKAQELINQDLNVIDDISASGGNRNWLFGQGEGRDLIFPEETYNPRAPMTRLIVKASKEDQVDVFIDGKLLDKIYYNNRFSSPNQDITVHEWKGVPLKEGDNHIVISYKRNGKEVQNIKRVIHYSNTIHTIEFVPNKSNLVANGVDPSRVVIRVLDRFGKPVRKGLKGTFTLSPPYVPAQFELFARQKQLAALENFEPEFIVLDDDGHAYIHIAPTDIAGEFSLHFLIDQKREYIIKDWLKPAIQDWVVVGFAEGSSAYKTLSGNMESSSDKNNTLDIDGKAKFYAKGKIKGEWIITAALDTDKSSSDKNRNFKGILNPGEYYTLYADGTTQRNDTASAKKLYIKIERSKFYALFGDYDSDLSQSELTRYNRSFTGLKSEYSGKNIGFKIFEATEDSRYARDEMQAQGQSFLYRLSKSNILINSDKIRIVKRDRFRSDLILSEKTLSRNIDYTIDYNAGLIRFKAPISAYEDFNPVFIIAEYETLGVANSKQTFGGRVEAKFLDNKINIGLTHIHEGKDFSDSTMTGADATLKIGEKSRIKLEAATSDANNDSVLNNGSAYRAEFDHSSSLLDFNAYAKKTDSHFGLGQQAISENGSEKRGALTRIHLGQNFDFKTDYNEQIQNTGEQKVLSSGLEYRYGTGTISLGAKKINEQRNSGDISSSQLVARFLQRFWNGKLEFQASAEKNITSDQSVDYPDRYLMQLAYQLTSKTKIVIGEELAYGNLFNATTTRLGLETNPWTGSKILSTLNQQIGEAGLRTFSTMGMSQSFLLNKNWSLTAAIDATRTLNDNNNVTPVNPNHPLTSGGFLSNGGYSDDYIATSLSTTFRMAPYTWNFKFENRHGKIEDKLGVSTNFIREISEGVIFSTTHEYFESDFTNGANGFLLHGDFSLAYRPNTSRYSLLDRLKYRHEEVDNISSTPLFGQTTLQGLNNQASTAFINNLNLNYLSLNEKNQYSLYLGTKYTLDRYDGKNYSSILNLLGAESRHTVFNEHWDIGLQGFILDSLNLGNFKYSVGPSVGFSPLENFWISLGYNFAGFSDRDFDAAQYTQNGIYLKLRIKFDEKSLGIKKK